VIAEMAQRVLGENGPIDWQAMTETKQIRSVIGKVVPGFEKMETIDETKEEFQIGGRTFHQPQFATPDGRAQLHSHELPDLAGGENALRLMTVRSEGQFNTVVYEEEDIYRGQDGRDVVLLNPQDVCRLDLKHDQRVDVCGPAGRLSNIRVREFPQIREGNALMYFPEANVLIAREHDSQSRTPAFKGAVVTIEADSTVADQ
jgi:anaerobic selenocysteine-containing dehydrogenase